MSKERFDEVVRECAAAQKVSLATISSRRLWSAADTLSFFMEDGVPTDRVIADLADELLLTESYLRDLLR